MASINKQMKQLDPKNTYKFGDLKISVEIKEDNNLVLSITNGDYKKEVLIEKAFHDGGGYHDDYYAPNTPLLSKYLEFVAIQKGLKDSLYNLNLKDSMDLKNKLNYIFETNVLSEENVNELYKECKEKKLTCSFDAFHPNFAKEKDVNKQTFQTLNEAVDYYKKNNNAREILIEKKAKIKSNINTAFRIVTFPVVMPIKFVVGLIEVALDLDNF